MHELSITEHLLKDCIREAQAQNASKSRASGCASELSGASYLIVSRFIWTCCQKGLSLKEYASNPRPFLSGCAAWTAEKREKSLPIIWSAPIVESAPYAPVRKRVLHRESGD